MDLSNMTGYAAALKLVKQAQTPRIKCLEHLEAYVSGDQYVGRPNWFSEGPMWEKAPCIVYPIAKAAIDSNVDLVLGEQTFPTVCIPHSKDELEEQGLKADEAELVNRFLVEFEHYTRLRPVSRELFASAQGCGSAVAIVAIRGGRPVVDSTRAAWCTPTLDVDGSVSKLVIEYPYLTQIQLPDDSWVVEARMYRRVIDTQTDITYKPKRLDIKSNWIPDVTVSHGLGFCPVIWYAHEKGCSTVVEFDGHAIHKHLLDEITALDFTLSQRHRAALYAGDPQWSETGVDPGTNPAPGGRQASFGPVGSADGFNETPPRTGGNVRKKSPGDVWQYENENAKVTLHTLPGDALTSLDNHAKDLKQKICEALGVVFLDPQDIPRGGELSARAIAALKARQLDRCDSSRSDFGDLCLRPLVTMLLRIVTVRPAGLRLPGLKKVQPLLTQLLERGLLLRLDWGAYSQPEPAEELALVQAATLALEKGIATTRSAVVMCKDVLHIEDIDEHMATLETETAERQQQAMDQMKAQADAKATAAPGEKSSKPNSAQAQTRAV